MADPKSTARRSYAETLSPEFVRKFWALVNKGADTDCWEWVGCVGSDGYGHFSMGRSARGGRLSAVAHRVSWELSRNRIPDGLTIDHLCRNRRCVNPNHLEPVTNRENLLRGVGIVAKHAAATTCQRGHAKTLSNARRDGEGCEECRRINNRAWAAKRRRESLAAGMCGECFKRQTRPGQTSCAFCAQRRADYYRAKSGRNV